MQIFIDVLFFGGLVGGYIGGFWILMHYSYKTTNNRM
jgi:hypothetical protein